MLKSFEFEKDPEMKLKQVQDDVGWRVKASIRRRVQDYLCK